MHCSAAMDRFLLLRLFFFFVYWVYVRNTNEKPSSRRSNCMTYWVTTFTRATKTTFIPPVQCESFARARLRERELCVCWNDEARIKTQHTRLMFVDGIQQRRQTMTVTAKIRSHRVQMYCVSFDHIVYECQLWCMLWCMCEVQAVVYSNGDCCRAKNQAIKGNSSRSHNSINFHFKRDFFLFVCSFAAFYSIHAKFRTHLNQCRHLHDGIVAGAIFLFQYLMNVGGNWKEKKTHTHKSTYLWKA